MDSFEFNKIAGAVLGSVLVLLVVSNIGNTLVAPKPLEKPVYVVEGVETEGGEGAATAATAPEADPPIETLLASASAEAGKKQFAKCASCHTIEKGGPAKVGPNLWGVIGAKHGHMEGFAYSDAIKNLSGANWDYAELYEFLRSPKDYAPGTKMGFAGLKKPEQRADLIAYLREQSDNPLPLP